MQSAPSVFQYLDYRSFLRDHYTHMRQVAAMSHRSFARRAGFSSPNFLKLVMDGQRNLALRSAPAVAQACQLDARGRDYFEELVGLQRARSSEERINSLENLMAYDERVQLFPLERAASVYFSRWWVAVVREMSLCEGFVHDPKWVARCFAGRISELQAELALQTLGDLGLLENTSSSAPVLSTGDEFQDAALQNYHRELLSIAADVIAEIAPQSRDISAIAITGDQEVFEEAKRMVQRFRKDLLRLERRARSRTHVYQVCFQLFPVATTDDEE